MASARVLAIWCMDWPAVAAAAAAGLSATAPVAVTLANRVIACSATARAAGVRRGLRRREAAARCPQLFIATADADRDARLFEGVIAAVDDLVPRAELLRPGLLVLPVRGPARFFGSEQMAAERLIDAVAAAGAECQVGIADRLSTAVFAARAGRIVEPGGDARFLSLLSIRQLATEPSLSGPGRDDLTDLLWRMGIRTIGQFAALSRTDVASRFGADAVAAHRFARGEPERAPCGREPPPDLAAELACDPPIDRVDAAAFAGRSLAAELHRALMAAGVGCTRLAIHAVTANGEERSRVWRCAEPLTEDATADRVRWQLDGWLNNRNARDRPTAAVTLLRLQAVETVSASEGLQLPLWGGLGEQDRLRARRALVRVQGLLGPEAVRVPDLDEIPDPPPPGAVVVFSAHGVSPAVRAGADERGLQVVDATCPLVAKVHAEAARFAARGDTVVFIGHAGHEETEGTLGVAPRSTLLVQTPADVAALNLPEGTQLSYLTQTTLALDETADVIDALRARFPTLGQPPSEDICYATTNRQRALQSMVGECDVVLVIGSCNSSNSRRLVELAQRSGTPAYLIDGPDDIEPEWLSSVSTIGVTAGASAPPRLVGQVIDALRGYASITVVERSIATETVRFGLPKQVRAQ